MYSVYVGMHVSTHKCKYKSVQTPGRDRWGMAQPSQMAFSVLIWMGFDTVNGDRNKKSKKEVFRNNILYLFSLSLSSLLH